MLGIKMLLEDCTSLQVYSRYSWTLCPYVYKVTYMYNK